MKSVNELGISPMPWVAMDNATVGSRDTDGELFEVCDCWGHRDEANARLIAAAPELYEALYNAIQVTCDCCDFEYDGAECKECPRHWWRDVLAKAAGEEANND